MSQNTQKNSAFTPKRIRRSIKLDRVQAKDFNHYSTIFCCEQCSFFDGENEICTMGYPSHPHRREMQMKTFNTTSHMAFCRFLEID